MSALADAVSSVPAADLTFEWIGWISLTETKGAALRGSWREVCDTLEDGAAVKFLPGRVTKPGGAA